jgi:mRNA-degrading endonuclease YafQ of YafQ-DinJ toxin-antitoxin module
MLVFPHSLLHIANQRPAVHYLANFKTAYVVLPMKPLNDIVKPDYTGYIQKKPLSDYTLKILINTEAFHPYLRTHKLTGSLQGSLACSAGYDLRIVFSFVKHKGKEAVLLETIGTH